jgi:phage terminase large subunit-like protein
MLDLELEIDPASSYIHGPSRLKIPETLYEKGKLVGWQWQEVVTTTFLKGIPLYDPFTSAKGYYFDTEEWDKIVAFITNECFYPEAENTGLPFIPEQWQSRIYANLFCWKEEGTNYRRFRECFIYVPRKNGKTTAFGAVLSLIMFFIDSEKRAQNFCCAADIEQASLNFRHCQYIIETNPRLLSRLRDNKVFRSTRSFEHTDGSVFKVLSSIADTKHGLSPNFVYVDEVHAHANSDLIDVMVTGTGARRQPLIVYTTTADFDRPSVCNNLYEKAKAIATDKQWEPTFLPVIYEAQLSDDFRSEQVWRKANPNFGVSITEDYFQRLVRNAENNPNELNRFLRLHLNVRTKTETAWIPQHIWANGNADPETPLLSIVAIRKWIEEHSLWHNIALSDKWHSSASLDVYIGRFQLYWSWYIKQIEFLKDEECYAGYDNATVKDIAALNLWFPRYGIMLHWGWVPAQSIYQRSMEQNLPYNIWWEAGLINSTSPQETVDENLILSAMIGEKGNKQKGIFTHFRGLREVCFDRWGAHHIFTSLKQYGLPARAYPQSFAGMNEPCRRMEALSLDHQLFHGGHPVLDWMIGNVVIVQSRDGQVRPDRSKSINKIDGIVAGLMAIGSYLYPEVETISEIRGLK